MNGPKVQGRENIDYIMFFFKKKNHSCIKNEKENGKPNKLNIFLRDILNWKKF